MAPFTRIYSHTGYSSTSIANGGTVSDAVNIGHGRVIFGLIMPAAFTGTAVTFQVSHDGTTYQALTNGFGQSVSVTVAASKDVSLGDFLKYLYGWEYIKVVSGGAEGAARTVIVIHRPIT